MGGADRDVSPADTRAVELGGTLLPAGAKLGVVALSANRDEEVFERAEDYDVFRPKVPHLASVAVRTSVRAHGWPVPRSPTSLSPPSSIACPAAPRPRATSPHRGWVFRGMTALPVRW